MCKCLYCGLGLRPIKCDFPGRQYHKKCWFEKLEKDELEYMQTKQYEEIQKYIQNEIRKIRERNNDDDDNELNFF